MRPQGQDIIRTWLFSTLLRSHLEEGKAAWKHAAISGWILDPDRKKMSKSKGNVVVPNELLEEHGSDGVRYWAASARLGTDAAFDVGQMKVGRRLANKLLNAARFVLSFELTADASKVTESIDLSMLAQLERVVTQATEAFEGYDHTRALEVSESFFWSFTDDYLELVKERAYGQGGASPAARDSAVLALRQALSVITRLLAPFLPFAAEETWSWWQQGSVHLASWPEPSECAPSGGLMLSAGNPGDLNSASEALMLLRKSKSDRKLSMKAEITSATVSGPSEVISQLETCADDLRAAGRVATLNFSVGDQLELSAVEFAETNE
jgi:valyl-tRNA synthetase